MKKVFFLILTPILFIVAFYFYGKQNTLKSDKYSVIINHNNNKKIIGDTLNIMTYNIGWLSGSTNNLPIERNEVLYKRNLRETIKALKINRPNIIAFQEIDIDANRSFNYNQPDSLAKGLEYKFGALAINWDKKYVPFPGINPKYFFKKTISAQYILSDLEIIKNSSEKLIKPLNAPFYYNAFYLDRLIQHTLLKTNKGQLMILNLHLEAFDEETREIHIKAAISAFNKYKNVYPTLLIGDFNSPQNNSNLRNEVLNKLFENDNIGVAINDSVYSNNRIANNTYSSKNPNTKIDFIFYNSDKIKKIDSDVMQEIGETSDHFPIWMKFVIIPATN